MDLVLSSSLSWLKSEVEMSPSLKPSRSMTVRSCEEGSRGLRQASGVREFSSGSDTSSFLMSLPMQSNITLTSSLSSSLMSTGSLKSER